eukprot:Nk52_evm1s2590 gene=Nk52_evmTU1s2590
MDRKEELENLIEAFNADKVGRQYNIVGLQSGDGQKLNGELCLVVGYDKAADVADAYKRRLQVKLEDRYHEGYGRVFRVKGENLQELGVTFSTKECPPVEREKIIELLERGLDKHQNLMQGDRMDSRGRMLYVREALDRGEVPAPTRCAAPFCEALEMNNMVKMLQVFKPGCLGMG